MKISILLPYKENFSPTYPGAVSIFVKDTTLRSKYNANITIFGYTKYKSKLLKNYVNLNIKKNYYKAIASYILKNFKNMKKYYLQI